VRPECGFDAALGGELGPAGSRGRKLLRLVEMKLQLVVELPIGGPQPEEGTKRHQDPLADDCWYSQPSREEATRESTTTID
jgi:hypothetical protein